ncbi:hypothetical protein EJ110_NYTH41786 [Nymphaea thermarum]|nr:hypothetical protein EJ110_NYTH41786 [Nymphaea thermarum]
MNVDAIFNPLEKKEPRSYLTLKAITILRFLPDNIEHCIYELGPLRVVPLRPVVPGAGLTKNKVIRPEKLTVRPGSNAIHRPRLEIHEDRPRNVAAPAGFIVVDVDALELKLGVTVVGSNGIDAVLVADHLPEFCADLVAALATLDVKDFSHSRRKGTRSAGFPTEKN